MTSGRTPLIDGARVLTSNGTATVLDVSSSGVLLRDSIGDVEKRSWAQLNTIRSITDGHIAALTEPLQPMWDGLDEHIRRVALTKLEVVQEILTGYRDGHPAFAREGEPRSPFGRGFGVSESQRCAAMSKQLNCEAQFDRDLQRRLHDGEIRAGGYSPNTIRSWVRGFKEHGLSALIDRRSTRPSKSWDLIDERYRDIATQVVNTLDGDPSTVSIQELDRRTRVQLKINGVGDLRTPQRITGQYLSALKHEKGTSTRAQRSRKLRKVSGTKHFPAIRPGQVVAIDATRADNLVFDALSGRPYSVEILTAIDVATRVVLAIRVVPMSANGIEAGLLIYDVCRPFSLAVDGTSVSDFRWVGLPEQLDFSTMPVRTGRRRVSPDFSTLQGSHEIPSVRPDAVRCDHGPIFGSAYFRALLCSLEIDLLLNRGGKPNDNPHVERWHETIQRGLQQIPGYKGRCVSERGRLVSEEPLLTAAQLQQHLRRFIALDYHRCPHSGLTLPNEVKARLCPLEMWDVLVELTGRIDVPQKPDLIYQFLPVTWGTISHAGVEFKDLVYDSKILNPYRSAVSGRFRAADEKAPFFVDPQDLSRIWFHDPSTDQVLPIEWRGANRTDAPMAEAIVDVIRQRIRDRGGNRVLTRHSATRQILDELTQLTATPPKSKLKKQLTAASLRVEQARIDHGEAQQAQARAKPERDVVRRAPLSRKPWPNLLDDD
ncbi:MAG: integrase family protein [Mycobacterium sp.]|nr:integrase family protein [Mycobacterium sp.]